MCPTIRIDDEVYGWLKTQAVPFDDTPNSVLRRLAGFETEEATTTSATDAKRTSPRRGKDYSGRRSPMASGSELIKKWNIPVRQARFHRNGNWYEQLTKFPAALCDPKGYVVFETKEEYRNCQQLTLRKQVNVPSGISSIPGYVQVKDPLTGE